MCIMLCFTVTNSLHVKFPGISLHIPAQPFCTAQTTAAHGQPKGSLKLPSCPSLLRRFGQRSCSCSEHRAPCCPRSQPELSSHGSRTAAGPHSPTDVEKTASWGEPFPGNRVPMARSRGGVGVPAGHGPAPLRSAPPVRPPMGGSQDARRAPRKSSGLDRPRLERAGFEASLGRP